VKVSKNKKIVILAVSLFVVFSVSMFYVQNEPSLNNTTYADWKLEDYSVDDCLKVKKDENRFLEILCIG